MSTQKHKTVLIWTLRCVLPLVILCALSAPLRAQQQEVQSDKQRRAAEIKAELAALRERLAVLQSQEVADQGIETFEEEQVEEATVIMPYEVSEDGRRETSASLTRTKPRLTPSTVTTITEQDIRRSQARSLYELLEMYVPSLQMMYTSEHPKTLGLRGILTHRSDRFLVLVNGREMNERTDNGAITELDLPMLTDIHHIDVVRGPSAALYGSGAQSMVINVITHNAKTFQGHEATVRGGTIERFATFEFKLGRKYKDSDMFVYGGVSNYGGADTENSPTVGGTEAPLNFRSGYYPNHSWGPTYTGGDKIKEWFRNLNEMPYERPKMKFYAEYNKGNFNIWGRYTQGGQWIDFFRWWAVERYSADESLTYSQAVIQANYEHELWENVTVKYTAGYERLDNDNENSEFTVISEELPWPGAILYNTGAFFPKDFAEDEIYGRVLARWTPNQRHSVALGGEWAYDEYGKGWTLQAYSAQPYGEIDTLTWWYCPMSEYSIDRQAIFGEYQWNINDKFTLFLNGRVDWHPHTEVRYSPRAVLIYTPNIKDTIKFIASRSSHVNTEGQIWLDDKIYKVKSPVEKLDAFELRYERQHNDALWFGSSVFLHMFSHTLGENPDDNIGAGGPSSVIIGEVKTWGFELEAGYHKDRLKVDLSHSYTDLLHMQGPSTWDTMTTCQLSVAPWGFGNDLAHWHNHTSKLQAEYQVTDKLVINGALCVLWGNPGGRDWADYRDYIYSNYDYQSGFDEPFNPSAYLNLGLEYKWSKNTTLNFMGYNLLGLFDEDINKRRVGFNEQIPGQYRIQPAAFGASLTHKF